MRRITPESLKNLMGEKPKPVLTMYVPTHRYPTPPNMQEDQTRFKNLLRAGCQQWKAAGGDCDAIKEHLEAYLNDMPFWQETIETLAVFANEDGVEIYHLPIECEERIYVGNHFDITPMLLVESLNQPSYVFALAMHEPKLFKSDLYGIEPVAIDFPKSPEDALNIDEMFSGSNTIRNGRQAGANSVASAPHGQGDANGAGTEERLMYLRILDDKIHTLKGFDPTLPLVIAATDTEFGDFRSISRSKTILDTHIAGNYTTTQPEQLHQLVTTLLFETVVKKRQEEALSQLEELRGADKSSDDLAAITPAAEAGRVDCSLLPMIDLTTDSVSDNAQHQPLIRYDDQFDETTLSVVNKVLENGGKAVALERGSLPNLTPLAAIYRY